MWLSKKNKKKNCLSHPVGVRLSLSHPVGVRLEIEKYRSRSVTKEGNRWEPSYYDEDYNNYHYLCLKLTKKDRGLGNILDSIG